MVYSMMQNIVFLVTMFEKNALIGSTAVTCAKGDFFYTYMDFKERILISKMSP